MHDKNAIEVSPDFRSLVRDLLGLDPAALAAMDPKKVSAAAGLHEFMRRTLDRALKALWAKEGSKFQLHSDASSKALRTAGWGDAKTYNLSTLLTHSLLGTARRLRGQPFIPLCLAEAGIVELTKRRSENDPTPMAALVAMAAELFEVDHRGPGDHAIQPTSICALIEKALSVSPEELVRRAYESPKDADRSFARDPDGQASMALAASLKLALHTYLQIIAHKEVGHIKFLMPNTPEARINNIVYLLTAGLLADGERQVAFLIPNSD